MFVGLSFEYLGPPVATRESVQGVRLADLHTLSGNMWYGATNPTQGLDLLNASFVACHDRIAQVQEFTVLGVPHVLSLQARMVKTVNGQQPLASPLRNATF